MNTEERLRFDQWWDEPEQRNMRAVIAGLKGAGEAYHISLALEHAFETGLALRPEPEDIDTIDLTVKPLYLSGIAPDVSHPHLEKIKAIKLVRELGNWGLTEAKTMCEVAERLRPVLIANVPADQFDGLVQRFRDYGYIAG